MVPGDETQGVGKFAALHLHHKIENVAAFPAAETVKNLLDRRDGERWCLFLVERAKPAEILASFLEADVFADNPNDVGLLLDPFGSGTRFRHFDLRAQFYNRDGFAAAFFAFETLICYQGMSFQKLPEAFA